MSASGSRYKFLTTLIPPELYEEVMAKSRHNMQDAANALQWHLHEGLCENYKQDIELLNVLPIGSFPQYYAEAFVKQERFSTSTGQNNINIGFCNIKLLRKYILPGRIYKVLVDSFRGIDDGVLFVYTISAAFMEAVNRFKKKKPSVKVCAVVADLPDMSSLSSRKSGLQKLFERHLANKAYRNVSCVDAYVLLTKHMADYMNFEKPFCVVEGIATQNAEFGSQAWDDRIEKTIMYTGTLHKKFGVLNLLKAFQKISKETYRLVICGSGDSEREIREAAQSDHRIRFLGQLPRKKILELQSGATVLVNPRQNNESFTKYSFPSKTMEYLSAGVPVVAYRLDGIPEEYDEYLCYVEDDSIQALADKLVEVCELSCEQRQHVGNRGRDFVNGQKNSIVQTRKIVELLNML